MEETIEVGDFVKHATAPMGPTMVVIAVLPPTTNGKYYQCEWLSCGQFQNRAFNDVALVISKKKKS